MKTLEPQIKTLNQNTSNKPTYSLSASLLNKLRFFRNQKTDDKREVAMEGIVKSITKVDDSTPHTIRGHRFEDEVFAGEHSVLNPYLENTKHQAWFSKILDFGDFEIRLSGRFDAVTLDNKHIYDIKRTGYLYPPAYGDKGSIQHDLYLFLCDRAEDFTYLVVAGDDRRLEYHTITHQRKPELESYIREEILDFLNFLYDEELIESYMNNFRFMGYSGKR